MNNRASRSKNTKCLNFWILYLWRTSKRPQDEDNPHDLCRGFATAEYHFQRKARFNVYKNSKAKFIQKSLTCSSYILSSWFIGFPFSSMSPILYSLWSVSAFLSLSPSLALKWSISFMSLAIYLFVQHLHPSTLLFPLLLSLPFLCQFFSFSSSSPADGTFHWFLNTGSQQRLLDIWIVLLKASANFGRTVMFILRFWMYFSSLAWTLESTNSLSLSGIIVNTVNCILRTTYSCCTASHDQGSVRLWLQGYNHLYFNVNEQKTISSLF